MQEVPTGPYLLYVLPLTDESRSRYVIGLSISASVVTTLPLFLVGALSVQMRAELNFSVSVLGLLLALYRISGAVFGSRLGRFADRLGPATSIRTAVLIAAATSLSIAVFASGPLFLAGLLLFGGLASTLGQAGANLALTREIKESTRGFAFGIKQSALPTASLLGGLTVPTLALTVGWRWAFVAASGLAVAVALSTRFEHTTSTKQSSKPAENRIRRRRPLTVLRIAMFFGMMSASTLSAFTVDAAVTSGLGPGAAGLLLTLGSLCAIGVRLSMGYLADRRGHGHFPVVVRLLVGGAIGYALLALGTTWALVPGVMLSFGLGWGWNGLFWFAVLRLHQATPGSATGFVLPGGLLGGVVGPIVTGWLIETAGYSVAWTVCSIWALAGAALMLWGRRLVVLDLSRV